MSEFLALIYPTKMAAKNVFCLRRLIFCVSSTLYACNYVCKYVRMHTILLNLLSLNFLAHFCDYAVLWR